MTFPFVLITGPTASGKSALALALAREFNGVILNCDSLQTYRKLDIGTAKPSKTELDEVPHFLIDVISPGDVLTAGDFRRMALEILERELKSRPVFGAGGSGFYIQALEKGMFSVPKASPAIDKKVRDEAAELGLPAMYKKLLKLDPVYADDISPNDSYRILRALIIIEETGKKVSDLKREFTPEKFPFPLLKIGLAPAREELLPRVQKRTKEMLNSGLLEEVRALLDAGLAGWPPLQSVGYKECVAFIRGEIPFERLEPLITEKTMQLAKKQRTWFKRDHEIKTVKSLPEARAIFTRFLDSQR